MDYYSLNNKLITSIIVRAMCAHRLFYFYFFNVKIFHILQLEVYAFVIVTVRALLSFSRKKIGEIYTFSNQCNNQFKGEKSCSIFL